MLGYSNEELTQMKVGDLAPLELRGPAIARFMEQAEVKEPRQQRVSLLRKDGKKLHADMGTAGALINGRKTKIIFFKDVSERKELEDALRLSEENFRNSMENSPLGIRISSLGRGKALYANKKLLDIYGFPSIEELNATPVEKRYTPESYKTYLERISRDAQGEKVTDEYEIDIVRTNGEVRHLQALRKEVLWNGNICMQLIYRDVSEQKNLQAQLIAQDRLAIIGQLTSGISHELNNPLTSIVGFSELLLTRDLPEDVKGKLKIVHDSAQRAARVVKNLLTFSRQKLEEKQPLSVDEYLQKVIEMRAYEHKINNINLISRFSSSLPRIMGNPSQMEQVFLNIMVNAEQAMIEAHHKGNMVITTEPAGDFVRISFTDDGPGIPEENMGRLFTPFFTTKPVGKGTGLGLSICHGIVSEHGGRIYAESEPGKGATFIVEFPAIREK